MVMTLIDFQWIRCTGGFRIDLPRTSPQWHARRAMAASEGVPPLRAKSVIGNNDAVIGLAEDVGGLTSVGEYFESYRPTEFPALFQQFAETPGTAEGMQCFFSDFGPLESTSGPFRETLQKYSTSLRPVLVQHAMLRRAVHLLQSRQSAELQTVLDENKPISDVRPEFRLQVDGKFALVLSPKSLIEFLWLQLALYAASDAVLPRCERCGSPYQAGSGTNS